MVLFGQNGVGVADEFVTIQIRGYRWVEAFRRDEFRECGEARGEGVEQLA